MVETFFERAKSKHQKPRLSLGPELMETFRRYRWAGNIRELENLMERMVLLSSSNRLTVRDLPAHLQMVDGINQVPKIPLQREVSIAEFRGACKLRPGAELADG